MEGAGWLNPLLGSPTERMGGIPALFSPSSVPPSTSHFLPSFFYILFCFGSLTSTVAVTYTSTIFYIYKLPCWTFSTEFQGHLSSVLQPLVFLTFIISLWNPLESPLSPFIFWKLSGMCLVVDLSALVL